MMKKIAVLGSTGSIGTQTLEVVRYNKDIQVTALAAGGNVKLMEEQIREFKPGLACLWDEEKAKELRAAVADLDVKVASGMEGLMEAATSPEADLVVTAVVGMIGIRPAIAAMEAGKDIALANKETLVTAGHIIMPLAREKGVKLLPVDSEHSAIFQCLQGAAGNPLHKILLTASGGPFRGFTREQLEKFNRILSSYRELPEYFAEDMIIKAPSKDIMNKLGRSVLALYSYDSNPDETSLENIMRQSISLIARMPTIMTYAYQVKRRHYDKKSMYFHPIKPEHSTAESILRSIRPDKKFNDEEAKLLDLLMIIHAEHGGGNNSTFTTRVLSSSGTDTYAAISAAIGSLKGPKHGGANHRVMQMMECVKEKVKDWKDEDEVEAFLEKIVRKEEGDHSGLIYGQGHAIYTLSDPRAVILKTHAQRLAKEKGMDDEFALYQLVEKLAPKAFLNVKGDKKVISANVDFYSGLVYKMLGLPEDLYTPMFAVSRIAGWCAHRIEEVETSNRIIRPAYKSLVDSQKYIPLDERK